MTEPLKIWTPERLAIARKSCLEWQGTPFRHHMGIKQVGTDCIHFVLNVLIEAEVIPQISLPFYDDRVGGRDAEEILISSFMACANAERFKYEEWFTMQDGDIVVFNADLSSNHCGFFIDGTIWHCLARRFVDVHQWAHIKKRVHSVIRVTEIGLKKDPATLDFNISSRVTNE